MHIQTHTHTHTHTHKSTHLQTHTNTHARTHTQLQTHTHTHTHTHTNAHTHTHMQKKVNTHSFTQDPSFSSVDDVHIRWKERAEAGTCLCALPHNYYPPVLIPYRALKLHQMHNCICNNWKHTHTDTCALMRAGKHTHTHSYVYAYTHIYTGSSSGNPASDGEGAESTHTPESSTELREALSPYSAVPRSREDLNAAEAAAADEPLSESNQGSHELLHEATAATADEPPSDPNQGAQSQGHVATAESRSSSAGNNPGTAANSTSGSEAAAAAAAAAQADVDQYGSLDPSDAQPPSQAPADLDSTITFTAADLAGGGSVADLAASLAESIDARRSMSPPATDVPDLLRSDVRSDSSASATSSSSSSGGSSSPTASQNPSKQGPDDLQGSATHPALTPQHQLEASSSRSSSRSDNATASFAQQSSRDSSDDTVEQSQQQQQQQQVHLEQQQQQQQRVPGWGLDSIQGEASSTQGPETSRHKTSSPSSNDRDSRSSSSSGSSGSSRRIEGIPGGREREGDPGLRFEGGWVVLFD